MAGLNKILLEGRIEDAREYLETFEWDGYGKTEQDVNEVLDWFVEADPSGNNKYLMWMVKIYANDSGFSPNMLIDLVQRFHKNLDKIHPALILNVPVGDSRIETSPKSIDSYPTYRKLKMVVVAAEEHESRKEVEVQAKSGADKIYDDERWLIVRPDTIDASCYYGAGTKWCTAMKNKNHFKNYTKRGNLYYIIDKTRKLGDYYKIALFKEFKGVDQWYDEKDNNLSGEVLNVITSLLPSQAIQKMQEDLDLHIKDIPKDASYAEFGVAFVEWVMRKNPPPIKTFSGQWSLQGFAGPGYDDPYITFIPTELSGQGYIHVEPFWDAGQGEEYVLRIEGDIDEHPDGGKWSIDENLWVDSEEFENSFWAMDRMLEHVDNSALAQFYKQLIWVLKKKVFDTADVIDIIEPEKAYWQSNTYSGQSFRFHYPPREGTMTQKLVDYVLDNPGKTRQEFYRDVLDREHTAGHNTTFFGAILASGILKGVRGPGRGRSTQFYKGPNYDAWKEGNLERIV